VGSELLNEAPSHSPKTFTEMFREAFPFYLSIGMTYELFWLADATLVLDYRKAYRISRERANFDAWLQGAYVYDALCAVSPVFHAFAKRGTKPVPYLSNPYPMHSKKKQNEKLSAQEGAAKFYAFAAQFNKRFETKST